MNTKHKIQDLGISLEDLYNQKQQLRVHLSDSKFIYSVILMGRDKKPDCKISSFGANLWFRTKNGENSKKYSTLRYLQNAIELGMHKNVDYTGEITYSLSNDIDIL